MNSAYIIPLDELDFSLLPNTYSPRKNLTPLWSLKRDDEICEFRIYSETVKDPSGKNGSAQNQEIRTTMCHICKVEVPAQYIKDHRASSKHVTYLKIANTAMQRLRDEVNNNAELEENNSLKYFCCHCTEVVNINDREKHDSSMNHRNALFMDKYISNFMELYANSIDTGKDLNPPEPGPSDSTSNDSDKLTVANQKPKIYEDDEFDLHIYLNLLKNKHHMATNIKVVGTDRLQIEIEGSKLEVSADNFHGMKNVDAGFIECIICKEIVRNEDKFKHMMDIKHIYRVTVPMRDIHCRREVYPLWHHCVLCNTIITNYKEHIVSDQTHNRQLEAALKYYNSTEHNPSSSDNKVSKNINKDFLNNNTYGILHKTSVDGSVKSNKANKIFFCNDCNIVINKTNKRAHLHTAKHKWNTESSYHYLYTVGLTTCRICAIDVTDFKVHIMSQDHVQKYKQFLTVNRLIKIDDNHYYCMFCSEIVFLKNELLHTYNSKHRNNISNHTADGNYYCTICNVTVPNTEYNIKTHNEGKPHIKNIAAVISKDLSELNADIWKSTDSPIHLICQVCNIRVLKNKSSMPFHLESTNHINKNTELLQHNIMELKTDNIYCKVCNVSVDNKVYITHLNGKEHLKQLKLHNESVKSDIKHSATVNEKKVNINKVTIASDVVMNHTVINDVISKTDRKLNENNILLPYFLKRKEEEENINQSNLNETINELEVSVKTSELGHNENHCNETGDNINDSDVNAATSNTECNEIGDDINDFDVNAATSNTECNETDINDSSINKIRMNEYSEYFKASHCPGEVICTICTVKVPFTVINMKEHLNGNKHKQKVTN